MAFRKQHKTAKGKTFDLEQFIQRNADQVALGNLGGSKNVNARGDILGKGGKIEVKREEVVRAYYREDLPVEKETTLTKVTATPEPAVEFVSPKEALDKLVEAQPAKDNEPKARTRRKNDD